MYIFTIQDHIIMTLIDQGRNTLHLWILLYNTFHQLLCMTARPIFHNKDDHNLSCHMSMLDQNMTHAISTVEFIKPCTKITHYLIGKSRLRMAFFKWNNRICMLTIESHFRMTIIHLYWDLYFITIVVIRLCCNDRQWCDLHIGISSKALLQLFFFKCILLLSIHMQKLASTT